MAPTSLFLSVRSHVRRGVPVHIMIVACLLGLLGCAASDERASPAGDASIADDPVTVHNCGMKVSVEAPPKRVVTMNQAATELALALGVGDRMVGTAYLDDEILPAYADAYDEIPVLSDEYPSSETLLEVTPDFVYGSYWETFDHDAAGPRADLTNLGIASYLSPADCPRRPANKPLTLEDVWAEVEEVGELLNTERRAKEIVAEQRAQVAAVLGRDSDRSELSVLWWHSGTDAPLVGACCGAAAMLMETAGMTNIFGDIEGDLANVSWEQVVERDPDVIVLPDATWSTAGSKRSYLESAPAISELDAVREDRFVTLPFSATTPSIRNADAVVDLVTALDDLEATR